QYIGVTALKVVVGPPCSNTGNTGQLSASLYCQILNVALYELQKKDIKFLLLKSDFLLGNPFIPLLCKSGYLEHCHT
ncbi:MAG: hypothetical protein AAF599_19155, partial [Bacteroidota bacterium]